MMFSKYRKKVNAYLAAQCATQEGFERLFLKMLIVQTIGTLVFCAIVIPLVK